KIYADKLTEDGLINEEDYVGIKDKIQENLQEIYNGMTEDSLVGMSEVRMHDVLAKSIDDYQTAVPVEKLQKLNKEMLEVSENIKRVKRLDLIINSRKKMYDKENKDDWVDG